MADVVEQAAAPSSDAVPVNLTPEGLPNDAHFEAALAAALKEAPPEADEAPAPAEDKAAPEPEKATEEKIAPEPAKAEEAAKDKEPEPKPEDKLGPGTLGKARRLFAEGKIEEALELALGVNFEKIEPTTKQWKAIKRHAQEARQVATQAKQEAENHTAQAKQVLSQVMPFVEGAQAYLKGDYAKFLQLTTGDSPEAFQRKLIAQLHDAPKSDPAVVARLEQLEREKQQERDAWQREQERMRQENNQLRYQHAVNQWCSDISAELKDAPQFAKVASKPAFVQRVFALQQQAYNARTQTTMDTLEAAEIVWNDIYGDVVDMPTSPAAKAAPTPAPGVTNSASTERTGNRPAGMTTIKPVITEAAPELAEPWSPERQERILERYSRMAKSELAAS